jgi:uncharacterized membrane protein
MRENVLPRQDYRVPTETRLLFLLAGAGVMGLAAKRGRLWASIFSAIGADLFTYGLCGHYLHEFAGLGRGDRNTPNRRIPHQLGVQIRHAVAIDRQVEDVYDYFRNFENLPTFMNHLQNVTVFDDKRSRWVASGPLGTSVEWDAEIINDVPNRVISWRSVDTPDVETAGSVRFVPLSNGRTLLQISMQYLPPAGALGTAVAKLFGEEPEEQIQADLRCFKDLMESGAVAPKSRGVESADPTASSAAEGFSAKRQAAGSTEAS